MATYWPVCIPAFLVRLNCRLKITITPFIIGSIYCSYMGGNNLQNHYKYFQIILWITPHVILLRKSLNFELTCFVYLKISQAIASKLYSVILKQVNGIKTDFK